MVYAAWPRLLSLPVAFEPIWYGQGSQALLTQFHDMSPNAAMVQLEPPPTEAHTMAHMRLALATYLPREPLRQMSFCAACFCEAHVKLWHVLLASHSQATWIFTSGLQCLRSENIIYRYRHMYICTVQLTNAPGHAVGLGAVLDLPCFRP